MKSFLIFLGLIFFTSAQVQDYVENIKSVKQMYEMAPPTDADIDNLVFPEQLQHLEVEGKCVLKKLIKNQNLHAKFDKITEYLDKNLDVPEKYVENNDIDMKRFKEACVDGKALIQEIFAEVRVTIKDCLQDLNVFHLNFLMNFVEKAFDFVCTVEKNDFKIFEDMTIPACFQEHAEEAQACLRFVDPEKIEEGVCSLNYKEALPCVRKQAVTCIGPDNLITRVIDFVLNFFTDECKGR